MMSIGPNQARWTGIFGLEEDAGGLGINRRFSAWSFDS